MTYFFQIFTDTIFLACIYTLVGTGFSLRYSITKYLDIGYSAYIALGCYMYLIFARYFDVATILATLLACALVAYFFEKYYFSKLEEKKSSPMIMMVASLGFMTLIQAIVAIVFTSDVQMLSTNISVYNWYGVSVTCTKIICVGFTFVFVILLNLFLLRTKVGSHIRAINDNKELAETAGIDVKKISIMVAIVSACTASLAGIFYGFENSVSPLMGMPLLLSGVTGSIIIGINNASKSWVGALLIALIQSLAIWFVGGEWKDLVTFGLLIITLWITF